MPTITPKKKRLLHGGGGGQGVGGGVGEEVGQVGSSPIAALAAPKRLTTSTTTCNNV